MSSSIRKQRCAKKTRLLVAGMLAASWMTAPGTASAAGHVAAPALDGPEPIALTLPRPAGPAAVGTVALHLVDLSRPDPWEPTQPARELMVSLWYPARRAHHHPVASWLSPGAAKPLLESFGLPSGAVLLPRTHGHDGAPVAAGCEGLPVVLYSPGFNAVRAFNTIVVEDLASRGYLVVTIDHTYEATAVEFPDGRVLKSLTGPVDPDDDGIFERAVAIRVADVRFVLDQLAVIAAGGNPDVDGRRLPAGLRQAFDLRRIGIFGHSLGGATAASAMLADARLQAGLSLDGPVYGEVAEAGLERPFMLLSSPRGARELDPEKQRFWSNLRGWRLDLSLLRAGHLSFGDFEQFLPALTPAYFTPEQVVDEIGEIAPARALAVQRAYPRAFFDRHLSRRGHLLEAPSPAYPEVVFVP